ncbi:DUF916 and DUF3324 domain-containing protein [Vagococcus hydrophili]|uniref:DUF916 and DUF3324 domain-containing protein n=1 Tax=Vagococcus hydrophili TaxID=2714947 RepID=A0A6G8ATI0_9ENTE|nr:DUF916 and DUF3324 domain-containing protein [Vagococcus hydrophili]QIL48233.1 DUF916 and DUF3324 domain-containing protein [Vagococcus hydrophili]
MKKFNYLIKLFFALAVIFSFSVTSQAAEKGIGYEVRPIFPSTQIEQNRGYYYLQTEPGVKQKLEMSLLNTSDKPVTLELVIENAISTTNGNIDYTDDIKKIHESLVNPMTEILQPKTKEVKVKAGEEKIVNFELTPPEKSYDGLKMGRILVKKKKEKDAKGINQEYQYAVGVITAESGKPFNDGDKLELNGEIEPNVVNGSKLVQGEIVNPTPKTIENLKVRSYVTKKGDKKRIKEKNIDNFSFAPNSKVMYTIPWGLSNFETGEYTFYFTGSNDFESFELKKDFKIRGEDAKKLNNEAAFSVGTPTKMIILIVVLNALLLVLCGTIFVRNKKWVEELKTNKKRKSRKKVKTK